MRLGLGLGLGVVSGAVVTAPFTPLSIPTIAQRFRADTGATGASWTDSVGGFNATGSGTNPVPTANVLNGQPSMRFAAGQSMTHTFTAAGLCTVFIVMQYTSTGTFGCAFSAGTATYPVYGTMDASHHWGSYSSAAGQSSGQVATAPKCCIINPRSTSDVDYRTGGLITNLSSGAPSGAFGRHIGLDAGDQFIGDIFEICVFAGSISSAQAAQLEAYSLARYGV